ncbi:MAG TPA: 3-dehydroquinate synthase [Polyangiaceae bacterium]|nr:3-dehydroquinate synthase [Polyangiaceae bacterium]
MSNSSLSGFRPSQLHEQRFSVDFEYPVVFCRGALSPSEKALAWCVSRKEPERRHPLFAVLDAGLVAARPDLPQELERYVAAHAAQLELTAPPLTLPGGEGVKNDPAIIADLHTRLAGARLDKQGTLLIIGGGAVLDAAGYAGSTTHRGVRVVRMPTTVLSQNDAGVGVKTSVNAFGAKNFLGTFAPPFAVINDVELLASLPLRDVRAGLAEAVKVALIRDVAFFEWLEQNAKSLREGERGLLEFAVRRCAELHLRHIASAGDPFERGSARPLDYGHWAAHKLETLTQHGLRHGEAVSIGMALDACYAVAKGMLSEEARTRLCNLLKALGLPTYHPMLVAESQGKSVILEGLREFREHLGGSLCITLLTAVGAGVEVHDMDPNLIASSIAWLQSHQT